MSSLELLDGDLSDDLTLVDDEGDRLRDIDFTDIYLSEGGTAQIRGAAIDGDPGSGRLTYVPEDVVSDLANFRMILFSRGRTANEFRLEYDKIPYRASVIDGQTERWIAVRRLLTEVPRLRNVVQKPLVFNTLGRIGKKGAGLILISGSTGSGKTTTAGAILQEFLLQFGDFAITIEDPPELPLEGNYNNFGRCIQKQVVDGDFAGPLRAALRYNPKYIFLGEIRDPNGASEMLRAASSGHLCIATIHSSSISEALTAVLKYAASALDMELARSMMATSISCVVNQSLKATRLPSGEIRRWPLMDTLFFMDESQGARTMIRDGSLHLLSTEIERQRSRILKDKKTIDGKD